MEKQTKIEAVPLGWKVKKLKDVFLLMSCLCHPIPPLIISSDILQLNKSVPYNSLSYTASISLSRLRTSTIMVG